MLPGLFVFSVSMNHCWFKQGQQERHYCDHFIILMIQRLSTLYWMTAAHHWKETEMKKKIRTDINYVSVCATNYEQI